MNGDDPIPVENETDEEKRSMKLMIRSGIIPDASMIHAARKKREMARQEGDFIPLSRAENTVKFKSEKSRFIRFTFILFNKTLKLIFSKFKIFVYFLTGRTTRPISVTTKRRTEEMERRERLNHVSA